MRVLRSVARLIGIIAKVDQVSDHMLDVLHLLPNVQIPDLSHTRSLPLFSVAFSVDPTATAYLQELSCYDSASSGSLHVYGRPGDEFISFEFHMFWRF